MARAQRELQITYGSVTVGGTLSGATLTLQDIHSLRKSAYDFSVEFSCVLTALTKSAFSTACGAFEVAMQARRDDLSVKILDTTGSVTQTLLNLAYSNNSALNTSASVSKPGSTMDTGLSRLYRVTVEGGIPTVSGLAGLREFEYDIAFTPSRKGSLTVKGTYTAVGVTSASAQYIASIDARVASIVSALTGTWEMVDEVYTPDDANQVVNFQRVYRELIYNESAGVLDNTSIKDQALVVRSDKTGADGAKSSSSLVNYSADYACAVDKAQTQDLETLWTGTIRPWIISNIETVAGGSALAITSEAVNFDKPENRISATIIAQARGDSDLISRKITVADTETSDKTILRFWPESETSSYAPTRCINFSGPRQLSRTITVLTTKIGSDAPFELGVSAEFGYATDSGYPDYVLPYTASGRTLNEQLAGVYWTHMQSSRNITNRTIGSIGEQIEVTDIEEVFQLEAINKDGDA